MEEGDYDGLVEVMGHLMAVKDMQARFGARGAIQYGIQACKRRFGMRCLWSHYRKISRSYFISCVVSACRVLYLVRFIAKGAIICAPKSSGYSLCTTLCQPSALLILTPNI